MQAKVLYLATGVFDKGGISRYSRYQIRALRELVRDENVRVLSLLGPGNHDFEEPFSVDYYAGGFGWRKELPFLAAAVRRDRAMRPSVIWVNHLRFVIHGVILRAVFRAPLVVNVYGRELWGGRFLQVHRRTLRYANVVLSDCKFSADFAARHFGVEPSRLRVVWDCVDVERFQARPRRAELLRQFGIPEGEDKRYILTLGRIERGSRYKGYDRLLSTATELRCHGNIVWLFGGAGDDVERLKKRARDEGLADRVFFLGSIPETALCDVYNLCDAFALVSDRGPSRGEGIPLTPLEAAACGKPIIVGDEDGSAEAVVQGVNGFIVSPRDPVALRRAVKELLFNGELRRTMGQAARARIEAEFRYETFREKVGCILDTLVTARKVEHL
jgi:phosphatidylinositol alpha-1,6-mannosyltransferase